MPVIREADFLRAVTDLATLTHWLCYHTYDSRRSQAGFPDLVLVREDKLIFAELKTNRGRVKPAQREWLNILSSLACDQARMSVYLWRPRDWDGIVEILTG